MELFSALFAPGLVCVAAICALYRRVDAYAALTRGASSGLKLMARIFPSLLMMLTAIYMLRACGALDALTAFLTPVLEKLGIPPQTISIMLIRPLSGSGALAAGTELIAAYGPDSLVGRTAAVMLGSTETTFYVLAVYLGAGGAKKVRAAIPAAMAADLAGFTVAALTVRLMWG
jgi:spore maturation protein B